jgi:hypothetical protein
MDRVSIDNRPATGTILELVQKTTVLIPNEHIIFTRIEGDSISRPWLLPYPYVAIHRNMYIFEAGYVFLIPP